MIGRSLLLLFLSVVLAAGQRVPGLDEAKAAFAKADRTLNEAWTAVKKTLPEKVFAQLKTKQREWIESRDRQALEASANPKDAALAKGSPAYWQSAASQTEERAQWLRQLANKKHESLTGLWIDGESGNLEIVERNEKLFFVFHVVRRRGFLGIIAGTAAWNHTVGWFSDKGREPDKTDETTISFTQRDGYIDVIGSNTSYYHGHHAYFDGTYYKIAPLEAKAEADVVKAGETGEVP